MARGIYGGTGSTCIHKHNNRLQELRRNIISLNEFISQVGLRPKYLLARRKMLKEYRTLKHDTRNNNDAIVK